MIWFLFVSRRCYKRHLLLSISARFARFVDSILSPAIFVSPSFTYLELCVSRYFLSVIIQTRIRMKFKLEDPPTFKRVPHTPPIYIPFVRNGLGAEIEGL